MIEDSIKKLNKAFNSKFQVDNTLGSLHVGEIRFDCEEIGVSISYMYVIGGEDWWEIVKPNDEPFWDRTRYHSLDEVIEQLEE